MKRIAIQGIVGSYHEVAARDYFKGEEVEIVACSSFAKMFEAMANDYSLIGVMAIENTIAGSLLQNHERLRLSDMNIVGEYKLRISHVIAALPGTKLEELTEIGSHPIALMQCEEFLSQYPNIKVVEKDDTATAAREVAEKKLVGSAAICSRLAAEMFGLEILQSSIETNKHNFTRFLVLSDSWKRMDYTQQSTMNKASFVFSLQHQRGSLSHVLSILSFYGINLTKIQSLPIVGREWEYQFYVDVTFDDLIRYAQSIEAVKPLTKDFKVLGEYAAC